jgi:hypothetical protein
MLTALLEVVPAKAREVNVKAFELGFDSAVTGQ